MDKFGLGGLSPKLLAWRWTSSGLSGVRRTWILRPRRTAHPNRWTRGNEHALSARYEHCHLDPQRSAGVGSAFGVDAGFVLDLIAHRAGRARGRGGKECLSRTEPVTVVASGGRHPARLCGRRYQPSLWANPGGHGEQRDADRSQRSVDRCPGQGIGQCVGDRQHPGV